MFLKCLINCCAACLDVQPCCNRGQRWVAKVPTANIERRGAHVRSRGVVERSRQKPSNRHLAAMEQQLDLRAGRRTPLQSSSVNQRPARVRGEHVTVLLYIKGSLFINDALVITVVRM